MRENISIIKSYLKLASPVRNEWLIQLISACFGRAMVFVEPFFASAIITNISAGRYKMACISAALVLFMYGLRHLAWMYNYKNYTYYYRTCFKNTFFKLYNKIFTIKENNLKAVSKEKILYMITNDIGTVSDLGDRIADRISYLVGLLIASGVLLINNAYACLLFIIFLIFNFLILEKINSKISHQQKEIVHSVDELIKNFSEVYDAKNEIIDYKIDKKISEKTNGIIDKYLKNFYKRSLANNSRDNIYIFYIKFLIVMAQVILIVLLSNSALTMALYLVIVAYFTEGLSYGNSFMDLFKELKNANISINRINTLLSLEDKELIKYGTNNLNNIKDSLIFSHVDYTKRDADIGNPINNINLVINKNDFVILKGTKSCGKRTLFNLLRRRIKPEKGVILLDGINIYDLCPSTYISNISYTTHKPLFMDDTILNNLRYVEKDKKIIFNICKKLGIHKEIEKLPCKYNTNVNDKSQISDSLKFLIGLARSLLTESEIIMIYELPSSMKKDEEMRVKESIKEIMRTRTIILFTADNMFDDFANKIVNISKGKIEELIEVD